MPLSENQIYSIVDVETTGKGLGGNRITEICIVRMQGNREVDKFISLVNPDQPIPSYITHLTGIDDHTVADAPFFEDIASQILNFLSDAIFVAHNVGFDYNVIRNEFKRLNIEWSSKRLCTVRLSRKLIPNLPSYSLGRLCSSLSIPLDNRHRAEGDTDATVILFQRLLSLDEDEDVMESFLNARSKESTLPPNVPKEQFAALPSSPGIYLFKDKANKVIYVGKAINIKKRVLSHFYTKKSKSYLMGQEIYNIDYEVTGNELVALLLEADMIRHYYPKFNSAQKKSRKTYQIISYKNQRGVIQLAIAVSKSFDYSVITFYNRAQAVEKLEQLCEDFNLCPRYCSLQMTTGRCTHYKLRNCEGICDHEETVEHYNVKVEKAIESLHEDKPTYIIKENGRSKDENCFVLVNEGRYQGYGYVANDIAVSSVDVCETYIERKQTNYHTNQILNSYIRKKDLAVPRVA
ncbi:exonuclease domain-containing protein [Nonlabens ponticola]|uniref:Excinuclease cho n=1 Tax=Nonlabens ponticola TaxID=2496866 RepID=A0A3S9N0G2_9FLAO|nr:exonuclease domain-containing protein [Nonlabens ponticola]AZQ44878.1 DNA polymerase III subunit epsilon [Nonlabens ponticola]